MTGSARAGRPKLPKENCDGAARVCVVCWAAVPLVEVGLCHEDIRPRVEQRILRDHFARMRQEVREDLHVAWRQIDRYTVTRERVAVRVHGEGGNRSVDVRVVYAASLRRFRRARIL